MPVDIGMEAIDRASGIGAVNTIINREKVAEIGGVITSIEIWAYQDITGLRVGTFYLVSGNTYKCRASQAIAGTITAGSKVTKAVSIAVEIGDLLGCYIPVGYVKYDSAGFAGTWLTSGEHIDPDDEASYTLYAGDALSLGGYIGVAGWTGEIAGVVNPASIMGKDIENIEDVKGVVSG